MHVIKRDGTRVLFDPNKIVCAINKAMVSAYGSVYESDTAEEIADLIGSRGVDMSVEQIQDLVESYLMKSEYPEVAKSYIIYRDQRSKERTRRSKLIRAVMKRTEATAVENSNANVDEKSFSGREKEASADVQKVIALDYTLSPEVSQAHKNMLLYQHDLEKTNIGEHNCFGRETEFITIDGVKSFYDFEDGDTVIVMNKNGQYESAVVHNYGTQDLKQYIFKNGKYNYQTIRATANHTWFLQNGDVTTSLKIGDKLLRTPRIFTPFNPDNHSTEALMMWCKGFACGDGTVEYNQSKINGHNYKSNRTRIRLCGEKDLKWLSIFEKAGCNIRNQVADNGDRFVCVPNYHKEIPEFSSLEEVYLFFWGLYAADGTFTNKTCSDKMIYSLQSSNNEVIEFIRRYADSIGMFITTEKLMTGQETNYGIRPYTVLFSFNPDFAYSYKLIESNEDSCEDVWCLETASTHSFMLAGGIPTGNCLFVDFEKVFNEGFVTRNGDIRPPATLSSACQQTAVIFQCQSQVQFGGVGTVHLDYDLAPFVKKSFRKHMHHYLTDVEDQSDINADAILAQHGPVEIDNPDLMDELPEAYSFAMKQLEREGKQAAEAMFHNLNTLESRAGSQVPFTSINFGRDTSTEGRFVTRKMLGASMSGIGKHHLTPIFPISIFQYKAGCNANPGDPNYDLKQMAIESLSKRIYPNFVNCDYSQAHEDPNNKDTYFATMGK